MILANKILQSTFVQGIIELITDSKATLLVIEAVLALLLIIWQLIRMQAATASVDDNGAGTSTKKYIDNIKKIVIAGVVIICVTALFTTILSYFN